MKTSLLIAGSLALVPMTYAQDKPNIIIILADDLGFSDLGCFGGEIHTPVLDKLAKNGVRMTQMYNSARSCPSRDGTLSASDRIGTHGRQSSCLAERIFRFPFQFG